MSFAMILKFFEMLKPLCEFCFKIWHRYHSLLKKKFVQRECLFSKLHRVTLMPNIENNWFLPINEVRI